MDLGNAYNTFFTIVLIVIAIFMLLVLLRAILGPGIGDRLIAINMIGTLTIMAIGVLAVKMKEEFLGDIPLVYAVISFIAVVILAKIYIGVHKEKKGN